MNASKPALLLTKTTFSFDNQYEHDANTLFENSFFLQNIYQ